MNNLSFVKAKVIEAIPEIIEPKPGRKIKVKIIDDWFSNPEDVFTLANKNEASIEESWHIVESMQVGLHPTCFEVISRPITLTDILRTIDRFSTPFNTRFPFIYPSGIFGSNEGDYGDGATWDLTKNLDGQSEEVIDFLYELLK